MIKNFYFCEYFKYMTGHDPFGWQERLFNLFVDGKIPRICDIPSGLGKTSVIAIWLLAFAKTVQDGTNHIPRRLVYVVNRRTIVDQATQEAMKLKVSLENKNEIKDIADTLRHMSVLEAKSPIAISTLRGQLADNDEWRIDPSKPAIVIGTVDMIGSRLLFSGYRCGFKSKPIHAAFLGQDVLLIHDEAHLEPAFQSMINTIEKEQKRCDEYCKFKVMELTATSRSINCDVDRFRLLDSEKVGIPKDRITAKKRICFHEVNDKIEDKVSDIAIGLKESNKTVLIYLRKIEDLKKVKKKLKGCNVQILTGTVRGKERDDLVSNDSIFARFMPVPKVTPQVGTVYLICTSAGEVGIDISKADYLICDVTPFDSMAQRFGRVNRFGNMDARIDIVYLSNLFESKKEFDKACYKTLLLLYKLPEVQDDENYKYDACPEAISLLSESERMDAFTPSPVIIPTTDILLDKWAMTSIRGSLPGRQAVASWLHGKSKWEWEKEWESSETYVAWRSEVKIISNDTIGIPDDILNDYPLKPHELLRDKTSRVFKELEKIKKRHSNELVWVISNDEIKRMSVVEIKKNDIKNCTILLSPEVGGLDKGGVLDGSKEYSNSISYDISDEWIDYNGNKIRCRVFDDEEPLDGMKLLRRIDLNPEIDDEEDISSTHKYWDWYIRPYSSKKYSNKEQSLEEHLKLSKYYAEKLVSKIGINGNEAKAIVYSAGHHDTGKNRKIWQRSVGNYDYPNIILAKSNGKMNSNKLFNYRHEFGSMLDIFNDAEFVEFDDDVKDLVLHLVAAHHGRARPIFSENEIFDQQSSDDDIRLIATPISVRFAKLQQKYGRWGLAYLESIVRAADSMAS
jgi:CRISPR-associated endonuclease/helicase Cas3